MKLTNKLQYPVAYMEAAKKHNYPKKAERMGVTTLIDSPQVRRLQIEHWDELEQDAGNMFVAMLGTAWHRYLEENTPKGIGVEKKWSLEIDGLTIVGVADVVDKGIGDYKLTSSFAWIKGEKNKWKQQLNILNYLQYKVDGVEAEYLKIYAFIKDWTKYKAMRDKAYPAKRFFSVDIEKWPLEKTEKFIKERIVLHKDLSYKCTDADKWLRIRNYAVMKKGAKRATRCFPNFGDAEQYIVNNNLSDDYGKGKILIECRKTEARRCMEFCSCKNVCPYGKTLEN